MPRWGHRLPVHSGRVRLGAYELIAELSAAADHVSSVTAGGDEAGVAQRRDVLGDGAIDVSTAAFATEHHDPQLAGGLLAVLATGSLVGGVVYGARSWRSGLQTRLLVSTLALAVLTLAPVDAPSIALAVPGLLLAGVPFAPTLTTAYMLAGERAPADRHTESYALLSLALNGGAALGGALGGLLVAGGSARPGFLLAATGPLLGAAFLAIPAVRRRRLRWG